MLMGSPSRLSHPSQQRCSWTPQMWIFASDEQGCLFLVVVLHINAIVGPPDTLCVQEAKRFPLVVVQSNAQFTFWWFRSPENSLWSQSLFSMFITSAALSAFLSWMTSPWRVLLPAGLCCGSSPPNP